MLTVRSDQAVTDPLVTLLVDLSWGRGELIKEYSLLLDPAQLAAARVP
jgi:pilus assembly protein FimV